MKRIIFLAAALLAVGTATAQAQTSVYLSVGKARSDASLQRATAFCDARIGVVQNGENTPQAYKSCMLRFGWRYSHTVRDAQDVYPDPDDPGLACHDFTIAGITGSSCSNF